MLLALGSDTLPAWRGDEVSAVLPGLGNGLSFRGVTTRDSVDGDSWIVGTAMPRCMPSGAPLKAKSAAAAIPGAAADDAVRLAAAVAAAAAASLLGPTPNLAAEFVMLGAGVALL